MEAVAHQDNAAQLRGAEQEDVKAEEVDQNDPQETAGTQTTEDRNIFVYGGNISRIHILFIYETILSLK